MNNNELKNIYNNQFYKNAVNNYRSAQIILKILFEYYKPNSVIDIGCGIGSWLKAVKEFGIDNIKGVDCNEVDENSLFVPRKYIYIDNLELHKNVNNEKYDLLLNIEVAEHLHNSCSEDFIKMLVSYSDIILFSAAIPYQSGINHINCQPLQFWYNIFSKYDYVCFDFRDKLMDLYEDIASYYAQNILLYVHRDKSYKFNNFKLTNRPILYYHPDFVNGIVNKSETDKLKYIEDIKEKNNAIKYINNKNLLLYKNINKTKLNNNWFSLLTILNFSVFSISNNIDYLRFTVLGIKLTFKVDEKSINKLAWWIPVKKWRDNFRYKFKIETRPDQTRPDQTRPDQTRPDQTRHNI